MAIGLWLVAIGLWSVRKTNDPPRSSGGSLFLGVEMGTVDAGSMRVVSREETISNAWGISRSSRSGRLPTFWPAKCTRPPEHSPRQNFTGSLLSCAAQQLRSLQTLPKAAAGAGISSSPASCRSASGRPQNLSTICFSLAISACWTQRLTHAFQIRPGGYKAC